MYSSLTHIFFIIFLPLSVFAQYLSDVTDKVTSLPGLGAVQGIQRAGHLPTAPEKNPYQAENNLFYWFVGSETNIEKAPLVLWLNGGPGSSSLYGFFAENGPYMIKEGALVPRPFSWSQKVSYLIIEQAPGVGFSYAAPHMHLSSESQAVDMVFHALKAFYKKYPELKTHPLFIAGESYAGKFIPHLATRIIESFSDISLQGILIGDGWVNPCLQLSSNAEFAYAHGLIDEATRKQIENQYCLCAEKIHAETPSSRKAGDLCNQIQQIIYSKSGVSPANICKLQEIDDSAINRYLNQKEVRKALHVDPRVEKVTLFSESVSNDLQVGLFDSAAFLYPPLLAKGVRVLIYNGLDDGKDCNFIGTDKWLAALEWLGKEKFKKATTHIWRSKTEDVAGYIRAAEGLTQVKIRAAGHLAPQDQPENVQDMVYRFIFHEKS